MNQKKIWDWQVADFRSMLDLAFEVLPNGLGKSPIHAEVYRLDREKVYARIMDLYQTFEENDGILPDMEVELSGYPDLDDPSEISAYFVIILKDEFFDYAPAKRWILRQLVKNITEPPGFYIDTLGHVDTAPTGSLAFYHSIHCSGPELPGIILEDIVLVRDNAISVINEARVRLNQAIELDRVRELIIK